MRCYLVQAKAGYITATRYAGTNALAKAQRDDLVAELGLKKKDVSIEQVEVPAGKDQLIDYLNQLVIKLDRAAAENV